MSNQGEIAVNYAELDGLSQTMTSIGRTIATELTTLQQYVNTLNLAWSGSANAAYQRVQQNWTTAMDGLQKLLGTVAQDVQTGSQTYATSESKIAGTW